MTTEKNLNYSFISRSSTYLSKSVGREKLARLGQYCFKLIFIYARAPLANHLQQQFAFLFKCSGLFKPIVSFQQLQITNKRFQNRNSRIDASTPPNLLWLQFMKCFSLFLWQSFEQFNILEMLNIVSFDSFCGASLFPVLAKCMWQLTLFWSILIELHLMNSYGDSIQQLKRNMSNHKIKSNEKLKGSIVKKITLLKEKKYISFRKVIGSILDSIIVFKLLNIFQGYDARVSILGIITSIWGIEEVWKGC